ncbi:MAG: glycogen debranching protein GlgX [Thermoleophilia bacterium]
MHPFGAHLHDDVTTFMVRSLVATAIDVVVPELGTEHRIALEPGTDGVWRGVATGLHAGQRYGLRVHGPNDPASGVRCDPSRVLVDPYARAIDGGWSVIVGSERPDLGAHPRTPLADTLLYEAHVRGLTRLHPDVPPHQRGTYAGVAHPAVIEELAGLGVTAIQLMPVHEHRTEPSVRSRGLTNYWGYSTLGYFAPHAEYSSSGARGGQVAEFRSMVRALHDAGIEVILDVVYNHTCEAGPDTPAMSFRGVDNPAWYWLEPADPSRYVDHTGCGNMLDPRSDTVREMVLASLRYWVQEMGVDGFRFDLAVQLGRTDEGFRTDAPLFEDIRSDPVVSRVKLIAEPWDLGPDGYQVGRFPVHWQDQNGMFRDQVRELWRGQGTMGVLAGKLAGSQDAYEASMRGPLGAVNFITAHDGFTLADLVSYSRKYNLANREENRDGHDESGSWNSGVEGVTDLPSVLDLRDRRSRGMLATLVLSAGVPMLLAGDERLRTQLGNNNAYCQDNPISWINWASTPRTEAMRAFVQRLTALRTQSRLLRRERFFDAQEVTWLAAEGEEMSTDRWTDPSRRALGMLLHGDAVTPIASALVILLNVGDRPVTFQLPEGTFTPLLDTSDPTGEPPAGTRSGDVPLPEWAVLVLRGAHAPQHQL